MAIDRQGTGLVIMRLCLGVFFIVQAATKLSWITDPSLLSSQLSLWVMNAAPGSIGQMYLQTVAVPYAGVFARLVPLGEFFCGFALLVGFFTPWFAFLAFFMVLNYQVASGTIFEWSFLANRSALPILGSTLALALGGGRLPWSLKG